VAVSLKRSLGLATLGAPLVLVATLSSCGDDDTAGSTVAIQSSSFTTMVATTATTAAPPAEGSPAPGQTVPGTQVYEVQSGDFLAGIAADYGIPVDSLVNFNDWPDGDAHVLHPGDSVNIPPGAQLPTPDDEDDEGDEDSESSDEDSEETEAESTEEDDEEDADSDEPELCPNGEPQGTYTIQEGDIPAQVAEALDVSVDELNEANQNTSGYSGFIVGIDINVPCGGDAPEESN
jgi:LysM repeat protein